MIILGIETSCDETGLALYDTKQGLLADALHSQVDMHHPYGGVVPELASRDHIRHVLPLLKQILQHSQLSLQKINAIAYTKGPGLAGALLVGASIACSLGLAMDIPVIGIHHLEGHLLSPLLDKNPPRFPFVALLVSGGHTQLIRVDGLGQTTLLGDTLDDAAGEAFDKTAKLLGLGYPGGPALSQLATSGKPGIYILPRPMLRSKNLDFSFSGLKTAVLTLVKQYSAQTGHRLDTQDKANIAHSFVEAMADILTTKSIAALKQTRLTTLVVSGGVSANQRLREILHTAAIAEGFSVYYPPEAFCTDNGAMIALAGAMHLQNDKEIAKKIYAFHIKPRWPLITTLPCPPLSASSRPTLLAPFPLPSSSANGVV